LLFVCSTVRESLIQKEIEMKHKAAIFLPIALTAVGAGAQPSIPVEYEIYGAQDIRDTFDPSFTDDQFDNARGIAANGDTLIISRTSKTSNNNDPDQIPGEFLVYRKNLTGGFDLMALNGDTVVGAPGFSLAQPREWYGWSIAMDGDTLVVGASYYPHFDDSTSTTPSIVQDTLVGYGDEDLTGAAFVFTRPNAASDTWTLQQVLYSPQPINGERYGHEVAFHNGRLLVVATRAFVPGFSAVPQPGCQNIRSEINVYEFSSNTNQYEISQEIIPPFMFGEAGFGAQSNGDPVDMNGSCDSPFPGAGIPPIHSRQDGISEGDNGFQSERARDISVDGDWLVAAANNGMYIYKYNSATGQYDVHTTVLASSSPTHLPASKGWTAIDISNDVIAISAKPGLGTTPGWTMIYAYDQPTDSWIEKTTFTGNSTLTGGSKSVFIHNDQVLIHDGKTMLRYIRATGELVVVGIVDFPDTTGAPVGPAARVEQYENVFLLPDNRANTVSPDFAPMNVRAINNCPYDLDSNGSLNFFDISAFITLYNAGDLQADYALPYGAIDSNDLTSYLTLYNSGCP
jgi:FG-GAP repeat protein